MVDHSLTGRPSGEASVREAPPTLREIALYFLRLGALGFGGPIALAQAMRRDLVEKRGWISESEYDNGLAIAAACPGPLAYQLGVYCGYVRFGIPGGLAAAVAFALPPFALVVAAGWLYVKSSGSWQLRALFYGVGPVVVALILRACWRLGKKTLGRDARAWAFFLLAAAITVIVERELAILFVAAGILGAFLFAGPRAQAPPEGPPHRRPERARGWLLLPAAPALAGAGTAVSTTRIFAFFFKTGLLVFGSGLVIVPFLKTYVVDQYGWIGNREFLDAVAIGMISPGPVVISATFVGYVLRGVPGAVAASVGIFAPAVLFTVLATPLLLRHLRNRRLRGFLRGITVAVVGVLAGTVSLVARTAVGDGFTAALCLATLASLARWKSLPEPVVVLAGAVLGLAAYPIIRPDWLLR